MVAEEEEEEEKEEEEREIGIERERRVMHILADTHTQFLSRHPHTLHTHRSTCPVGTLCVDLFRDGLEDALLWLVVGSVSGSINR